MSVKSGLASSSAAQMYGLILAPGSRIIYLPLLIADRRRSNERWIPAFKILLIKPSVVMPRRCVWPEMITHDCIPLADRRLTLCNPHTSVKDIQGDAFVYSMYFLYKLPSTWVLWGHTRKLYLGLQDERRALWLSSHSSGPEGVSLIWTGSRKSDKFISLSSPILPGTTFSTPSHRQREKIKQQLLMRCCAKRVHACISW